MYLYHVLFTLINIYGVDCQKKSFTIDSKKKNTGNELSTKKSES
jgi:hypothetical protein